MNDIQQFMAQDHRDCDENFVQFENAIVTKDWPCLSDFWKNFSKRLLAHFDMEESILFPAFEQATQMSGGPTAVMRGQHDQMRLMLQEIDHAIDSEDDATCEGGCRDPDDHDATTQHDGGAGTVPDGGSTP